MNQLFKEAGSSDKEKIKKLRTKARDYQRENNLLVETIWNLDLEVSRNPDLKKSTSWLAKYHEIEAQISSHHYQEKIDHLLNEIHDLEVKIYGSSKVGGSSPYIL